MVSDLSNEIVVWVAAAQDSYGSNSTWKDLDGDIELFLGIEELLVVSKQATGNTKGWIGIGMWKNYYMKTVFTFDFKMVRRS